MGEEGGDGRVVYTGLGRRELVQGIEVDLIADADLSLAVDIPTSIRWRDRRGALGEADASLDGEIVAR